MFNEIQVKNSQSEENKIEAVHKMKCCGHEYRKENLKSVIEDVVDDLNKSLFNINGHKKIVRCLRCEN